MNENAGTYRVLGLVITVVGLFGGVLVGSAIGLVLGVLMMIGGCMLYAAHAEGTSESE
jgi:drug/metabolite transporter (DMT)-like permease